MKVARNKANQEQKKRRKTDSPGKNVKSEPQWSNSSIKFLAEFYGVECSEDSVPARSNNVAAR